MTTDRALGRPGELRLTLTLDELRWSSASIPRNPLFVEPMFLARYAEKAGSGILEMTARCCEAGLPTPEFRQSGGYRSTALPMQARRGWQHNGRERSDLGRARRIDLNDLQNAIARSSAHTNCFRCIALNNGLHQRFQAIAKMIQAPLHHVTLALRSFGYYVAH